MCGRISLFTSTPDLEARFDATAVREFPACYNVAPGEDLAVVTNEAPDAIDAATWGLLPAWVDDPAGWSSPINARAETLEEKPSFREAAATRRCLILVDGYYEWQGGEGRGRAQPYRFSLPDDEPFALAGLWERRRSGGETRRTCAVVTTEANAVAEPVHHRMPVVLSADDEDAWLHGDADERRAVTAPDGGDDLLATPISTAINDPGNDHPGVIDPVDPGTQTGLGDFA
ncbi:MAG: SOS response-associated peptidase [Salinigranum sp.]